MDSASSISSFSRALPLIHPENGGGMESQKSASILASLINFPDFFGITDFPAAFLLMA